ncbi:DUF6122 family protein [Aquimarina sp. SS2-1]|uniref:DUF6122 family protein n=1 Tax=Aquimarina besae TaxID=3342247 RepID=UPI003672B85E
MLRFSIHYGFHFVVPLLIALIFFPKRWNKVYLIFLSAMFIDLDHLFANPIFDPNRCSIGFHFLHSFYAIFCYGLLLIPKNTKIIGFALLWHILTDLLDCQML